MRRQGGRFGLGVPLSRNETEAQQRGPQGADGANGAGQCASHHAQHRYVHLENPALTRNQLYAAWEELGVLGQTYVASEGINAQFPCADRPL